MDVGSFVKIAGLQSDAAKQHNGKTGVVTGRQGNDSGRYCVRPHGMTRGLAVKSSNLIPVGLEDALRSMMKNAGRGMSVEEREQYKKECRLKLVTEELVYKYKDEDFVSRGDYDEEIIGDDEYYDFTEVDFHRPDGSVETKDVQWCLDNRFYQIEEDYWSGDWYFRDAPNVDKQVCVERTLEIRKRNEKRREYIHAKCAAEANAREEAEKQQDEDFMKVLIGDMARMTGKDIDDPDLFRSPISGERPSAEHVAQLQRLARTMK